MINSDGKETASAAAPFPFVVRGPGVAQRSTIRPTYAAKPCRKVTLIVIPPDRRAVHAISSPERATRSRAPETATSTVLGTTPNVIRSVAPRRMRTGLPEAAIGAPQRLPTHQEEIESRTWPGSAYAAGGLTLPTRRAASKVTISVGT